MSETLAQQMTALGKAARKAARQLATTSHDARNKALTVAAQALRDRTDDLLAANGKDVAAARETGKNDAFIDRLALDPARVEAMAAGLEAIAGRDDPIGRIDEQWSRPNGLLLEKVRVPVGVLAIIFESRPNVAADAAGLCLKSGNAAILRGGSDSVLSVGIILDCITDGLRAADLPLDAIQTPPTTDRAAVGHLLTMVEHVDLVIPRGGQSLVARVQAESRVPVLAHLMGLNHTYVHAAADVQMAKSVVKNAKLRRTGVCGATETLLIDKSILASHLPAIADELKQAGCVLHADQDALPYVHGGEEAGPDDWDTEWLDAVIGVRTVEGMDEALAHIADHGTGHTECIVTEDDAAAETFLRNVDAAIVMHNASTQFADGGEFGFGAEIGIATGRLHARGPVGADHLTTYKYLVRGTGQTRP